MEHGVEGAGRVWDVAGAASGGWGVGGGELPQELQVGGGELCCVEFRVLGFGFGYLGGGKLCFVAPALHPLPGRKPLSVKPLSVRVEGSRCRVQGVRYRD